MFNLLILWPHAGSYNVQDCDVSTDHTSILVECTFAINSTAPGIVVIQDDQSQYTINKTLQRLQQDSDKGSVNITGLPAGEYSVRVYDNIISPATDTAAAAYEHSQLLHIVEPQPSPTLSHSAIVVVTFTGIQKYVVFLLCPYLPFTSREFACAYNIYCTQQCLSYHNTCSSKYVYHQIKRSVLMRLSTPMQISSSVLTATITTGLLHVAACDTVCGHY